MVSALIPNNTPADLISPRVPIKKAYEMALYYLDNFLCPLNEVVDYFFNDAYRELTIITGYKQKKGKQKPVYKYPFFNHQLTLYANRAKESLSHIIDLQKAHTKGIDRERFLDYSDNLYEQMYSDVHILYQSILQELTRGEAENRVLLAHFETVKSLLLVAVKEYNNIFDDIAKVSGYAFHRTYLYLQPRLVLHDWQEAENIVVGHTDSKRQINIRNSAHVALAREIIRKKLVGREYLDKAFDKTLDDHPELLPSPDSLTNSLSFPCPLLSKP